MSSCPQNTYSFVCQHVYYSSYVNTRRRCKVTKRRFKCWKCLGSLKAKTIDTIYNSSAQNVAADGLRVSSRDRREQPKKYSLPDIFALNHTYASAHETETVRILILDIAHCEQPT